MNLWIKEVKEKPNYYLETAMIESVYDAVKNIGLDFNFTKGVIKKFKTELSSNQFNVLLFFESFERFTKSQYQWFLRLNPYTYFNPTALDKFIKELNQKYDPSMDPVIKGAVFDKSTTRLLILSGGLLISRKAAEELIWHSGLMKINWMTSGKIEDFSTIDFIESITLAYMDTHNSRFASMHLDQQNSEFVKTINFNVPQCSEQVFNGETTISGVPIKDLITLSYINTQYLMMELYPYVKYAPNNIFLATDQNLTYSYICNGGTNNAENWKDRYV
ncbi:hypothetical protein TVAG_364560 [Trichomonas vaginalis G3]|uniref:Uncharacterized protein n=1 Tax=Trichomonas vaginalis (strain ATCC PRA-98 / G3) TaxID=412133 RepID=A2E9G7_TRIV3|nr:hypothetical protein TVAGG3_0001090 [Trichomonas vaginalis G3]EAY10731.1 hypothetical protein TVAG_364560 [Trichomonas vaginalis G3]KAI5538624.1 hypothetical protein TVAGG3_0001090 [Trichomonas vaginalis G3]|eukprot:XP_001322954.1 hypothetical protein [Trichomonas vaginalis G3]